MKEYKVLRDCWGYKGRHYVKDSFVLFDDADNPPRHFEFVRIAEAPEVAPAMFKAVLPKDPMRPRSASEGITPVGGMNTGMEPAKPNTPITAGEALKRSPGRSRKA